MMQNIGNILIGIMVVIAVIFVLNLLNKAAEYLEAKALEAGREDLAALIGMANSAITQAVAYVNQTYVDSLKAAGKFDKEAQVAAFNKAVTAAEQMLTTDVKDAIIEIYGDLSKYLETKIEETCRALKTEAKKPEAEKDADAAVKAASVAATVATTAIKQLSAEAQASAPTKTDESADCCVVCGEIVPEGTQVCKSCQDKARPATIQE